MTHNTLGDMHNLLMEQMERLADTDIGDIDKEVKRANAMAGMAAAVNNNAAVIIKAANIQAKAQASIPNILTSGNGE